MADILKGKSKDSQQPDDASALDGVDTHLSSPDEYDYSTKKFWKEDLDNNDLLKMYRRKGVAYRTINKETDLMFKNGWTSEDETAKTISEDFNFDRYVKYARKNAAISGYSLIIRFAV